MSVTVGMKAKAEAVVNDQNTAISAGSGTLPVFATPWMCALMEQAAWTAVAPGLAEAEHLPRLRHPCGPEGLGRERGHRRGRQAPGVQGGRL